MALTGIKEIQAEPNATAYRAVQWLIENGFITEANLDGLTTVAGLVAAANAVSTPEINKRGRAQALTYLQDNATELLTNANVTTAGAAALNARIAALRNVFIARDTRLSASTPPGLPQ